MLRSEFLQTYFRIRRYLSKFLNDWFQDWIEFLQGQVGLVRMSSRAGRIGQDFL